MSTSEKPVEEKRALLIAVKHVVCAVVLSLSMVRAPRIHLASYDYEGEDVILMLVDDHHPEDLWPMRRKILRPIRRSVSDPPGARPLRFLLWQIRRMARKKATQMIRKPTGAMRALVAADGKRILDDVLHNLLIAPLQRVKGSTLFVRTVNAMSTSAVPLLPLRNYAGVMLTAFPQTYGMVKDRTSIQGRGLSTVARCSKVSQRQAHNFYTTVRLGKKYCEPIHNCPPNPSLQSKVLSDTPTSDTKNVASNNVEEEAQSLSVGQSDCTQRRCLGRQC
ncbi:hypothetical protein BU15DRAFT_62725 [Melanogaster broomeanus]|nr:hypothetical protein BU15DRAFT_62725 [Melanogaster broomeanus]